MPTHQLQLQKDESYFVTFTCYKWISLFEITSCHDYFYNWFKYLNEKHTLTLGFVIMPNHFHGLLHVKKSSSKTINQIIANAKRFLAYEIVKRLIQLEKHQLLHYLKNEVPVNEQSKGKLHQVFMPSFDAKPCHSLKMLETKLEYIHSNPVSGKWNLVGDYTSYNHSSAQFYELGKPVDFLTHYKDVWG